MAAQIREVEHSRRELVRSVLEVGFPRRSQSSIQIHLIPGSPGPAFHLPALLRELMDSMLHLLSLNSLNCLPGGQALSVAMWARQGREEGGTEGSLRGQYPPYASFLLKGGSMAKTDC